MNISEDKVCYIHKCRLDFHFTHMYRRTRQGRFCEIKNAQHFHYVCTTRILPGPQSEADSNICHSHLWQAKGPQWLLSVRLGFLLSMATFTRGIRSKPPVPGEGDLLRVSSKVSGGWCNEYVW